MKLYISHVLLIAGCSMTFYACDDNSWNKDLDGFDEDPATTDVRTIEYTLTATDYKNLASNSENKALAGTVHASDLAAVGSQCYFTDIITPRDYVPALLSSPLFPYFTLSDGSAIKLTYDVAVAMPEEIKGAVSAGKYTVSDADYQSVWGSGTDYAAAFSPSHTADRSIPSLLEAAYPDAMAGQYVIVNYNTSDTDPVFGDNKPEVPEFELSEELGSIVEEDVVDVRGYVSAICTQGVVVTDATGSLFVYLPANLDDLKLGDQVKFSTTIGSYNYGLQSSKGETLDVVGTQPVIWPAARSLSASEIDAIAARTVNEAPIYASFTGKVVINGNYINIVLDGTSVQVSPYGASGDLKSMLSDGSEVSFEGYVVAVAGKGKYLNTIITKMGDMTVSSLSVRSRTVSRVAEVASVSENAMYVCNGTTWSAAPDFYVLSHDDYRSMGQKYDNLSGETPASVIPVYMSLKCPYAQSGDAKFVVYYYYNGSSTDTRCDQYVYNGDRWELNNGVVSETAQFVRTGGKWMYDPNVTITLPAGKGIEISTLYYQTCVDWVKNNVPDGAAYVSSYGNNEYYCGTSAYQGNVDLRPSAAKIQYAGYSQMSDDEVVALEKTRFESEVFPAALSILHPDAAPVEGLDVIYTINFYYYDGVTQPVVITYKVVGKAQFEFVSCSWNEDNGAE